MLLSSADRPPTRDAEFAYEVKWDGMRAICAAGSTLSVWSRRGNDFTAAFPELAGLSAALDGRQAVFDGELVCMDGNGRPSFARIRRRWAPAGAERAAGQLALRYPATLIIFDLLQLDGADLTGLPYVDRRARLAELGLRDRHWLVTDFSMGQGQAVLDASRAAGLEGIVAKRLSSRYRPGMRTLDWLKIKNYERDTFSVGGWLATPDGGIEALLVGKVSAEQKLEFQGTVEFGLDSQRRRLREVLELMSRKEPSFAGWRGDSRARFVQPRLRARVRFIGRDAGVLREAILEDIDIAPS